MTTPIEAKWTWRRLYTYGVTVAALALLAVIVWRIDAGGLKGVAWGLIALIGLLATYYLIAPTAEHIVAALRAWRGREPGSPG